MKLLALLLCPTVALAQIPLEYNTEAGGCPPEIIHQANQIMIRDLGAHIVHNDNAPPLPMNEHTACDYRVLSKRVGQDQGIDSCVTGYCENGACYPAGNPGLTHCENIDEARELCPLDNVMHPCFSFKAEAWAGDVHFSEESRREFYRERAEERKRTRKLNRCVDRKCRRYRRFKSGNAACSYR